MKSAVPLPHYHADVRPADPHDRRTEPDAHTVILIDRRTRSGRVVGVYPMKHQADDVANTLNRWAGVQIR